MLTVTDEPTFLPTSKINLILNVEENKNKILQILDLIQSIFNKNNINLNHIKDSEKIFSALNGAYLLGKNLGGKILIFSASNAIGKLPQMNGGLDKNATREQIAYIKRRRVILTFAFCDKLCLCFNMCASISFFVLKIFMEAY